MSHWQTMAAPLRLRTGELHIWKITLDRDEDQWQSLMALLSTDEQIKANRYRFEQHRRRYTVGRAALRILLGGYLGRAPEAFHFLYNDYGKPFLADDDSGLRFNVAHSGDIMLAGFVSHGEIGIDVETIHEDIDYMGIGQRWFSEQESNTLRDLPEAKRIGAFFRAWTRKEAYIKARGLGLSYPLHRFTVSLEETSPSVIEHQDCSQETQSWQIHDIAVSSAYAAAVAMEAARWDIRHYHLEPLRERR